jgi:hypothetical protein
LYSQMKHLLIVLSPAERSTVYCQYRLRKRAGLPHVTFDPPAHAGGTDLSSLIAQL